MISLSDPASESMLATLLRIGAPLLAAEDEPLKGCAQLLGQLVAEVPEVTGARLLLRRAGQPIRMLCPQTEAVPPVQLDDLPACPLADTDKRIWTTLLWGTAQPPGRPLELTMLSVPVSLAHPLLQATLQLETTGPCHSPPLTLLGQWCAQQLGLLLHRLNDPHTLSTQQLTLLDQLGGAVSEATDLNDLFRRVTVAVAETMQIEHVGIALLVADHLIPQQGAQAMEPTNRWTGPYPVSSGIAGRVARTGFAALLPDVTEDPDYVAALPEVISELCVPLLDGERVVGVLNLESESRRLNEADLRQMQLVGSWVGRAIERERLYAATEQQRQALEVLHQVRTAVSRQLDLQTLIEAVNESIAQTLGYSQVSIYLRERDELVLQHQLGYDRVIERLHVSQGVMGKVARTGEAIWLEHLDHDPDALRAMEGINSEVCVPLWQGGQVVGVLNVESMGQPGLTAWDAQLIGAVGEYVQYSLDRAALHAQVQQQEALYRLLAEHTSDLVCLHHADGRPAYVSPSVQTLLGYWPEEVLALESPLPLICPEDRALSRTLLTRPNVPQRWRLQHRAGHTLWFETTVCWIESATPRQFLSTSRDVTLRQAAETRLAWAATHDALTGLPNRTLLLEQLDGVVRAQHHSGQPQYAVLYLDVDHFKTINDSLGHAVGDELLVALAARLRDSIRQGDLVARLGGDEFVILLRTSAQQQQDAERATARLKAALDLPFALSTHTLQVKVSIGMAVGHPEYHTPADVLRDADLSMYQVKRIRQQS